MAVRNPRLLRGLSRMLDRLETQNPTMFAQLGGVAGDTDEVRAMARAQEVDDETLARLIHDELARITTTSIQAALIRSWPELTGIQQDIFRAVAARVVMEIV